MKSTLPGPNGFTSEFTPLDTRGPKRLWSATGTSRRTRGDVGRMVEHDYRCPSCGVFTARVLSSDVPDELPCPREVRGWTDCKGEVHTEYCGLTATWSPSTFRIGKAPGEVTG